MFIWNWKRLLVVLVPAFFIFGMIFPVWFLCNLTAAIFAVSLFRGIRAMIVRGALVYALGTLASLALSGACLFAGLVGNWFLPHLIRVFV